MPPSYFPLRWESTGDQWWYASPIDFAAANGHYDLVRELLHLDPNLLIKLTSLRRIRRLETVWDDDEQFSDAASCRSRVARRLLRECEAREGPNSLIRAGYGGWLIYTAASAGDLAFVMELLAGDPLLVFGEGEYGVTDVLCAAARGKNSEAFRLLLDCSLRCCGRGEGDAGSVFRSEIMKRAVHAAARGGSVEILRELLGDCSDVLVYRDMQGSTLLHAASGRGQVEVVKYLLESFEIINLTDNQGNTALHVAAYRGYLSVVEVLIAASPSSISSANSFGDTFLHAAVAGFRKPGFRRVDRQIELMKCLVKGKIVNLEGVINAKNNDGRTALHMAVIENVHLELVELLMTVPCINLNHRDGDQMMPLDLLKQRPQSASSEILIKRLISAGGISNYQDYMTRTALASQLKTHCIGGSPGTSFRVPDSEIIFYSNVENASDGSSELVTFSESPSQHISPARSIASENNSGFDSVNYAARKLRILLGWARAKERDDEPSVLYGTSRHSKFSPIPLRERFSKHSSLPNNKRVVLPVKVELFPSPSTKKKYYEGLTQGVLQMEKSSASSPCSEASWASRVSNESQKGAEMARKENEMLSASLNALSKGARSRSNQRQGSLNKRLMNRYFCFGAQGLGPEDSVKAAAVK